MTELQKAKAKADRYFSLYIRSLGAKNLETKLFAYNNCCTCGKAIQLKQLHCGHFQSRRYESTRYDEKNAAPQCSFCNTYNQGEQYKFGLYLDGKYGKGTAEKITIKSRMFCKRNRYDYQVIAKEFKDKLK